MTRARRRVSLAVTGLVAVLASLIAGIVVAPAAQAYDEDAIVQLVNEARWADGSAGLVRNPDMDAVALAWAQQLVANGSLSHNPDYASQVPGGWTHVAENVAQGYGSAESVMDGWMNSSGHRANILGRPFTDIGVALIEGGGTTWGVQVFAAYPGHSGPSAPEPVAEIVEDAPPAAPEVVPSQPPTPTPTPSVTPTPTPTPTPTATSTPTPSPTTATEIDLTSDRGDPGPVTGIVIAVAGLVVLLIALAWYFGLWRRRRTG